MSASMVMWLRELHGQRPGFEDAVLLADEDAAFAGDGEGLVRLGMGLDHGAGGVEGDGGRGLKTGAAGWERIAGAKSRASASVSNGAR